MGKCSERLQNRINMKGKRANCLHTDRSAETDTTCGRRGWRVVNNGCCLSGNRRKISCFLPLKYRIGCCCCCCFSSIFDCSRISIDVFPLLVTIRGWQTLLGIRQVERAICGFQLQSMVSTLRTLQKAYRVLFIEKWKSIYALHSIYQVFAHSQSFLHYAERLLFPENTCYGAV